MIQEQNPIGLDDEDPLALDDSLALEDPLQGPLQDPLPDPLEGPLQDPLPDPLQGPQNPLQDPQDINNDSEIVLINEETNLERIPAFETEDLKNYCSDTDEDFHGFESDDDTTLVRISTLKQNAEKTVSNTPAEFYVDNMYNVCYGNTGCEEFSGGGVQN